MRIASLVKSVFVVWILAALLIPARPVGASAAREESQQLTDLLGQAADEATELARDADETESLIRSDVSWQTHADMLDRVKEHVNKMARITEKLSETRTAGSELQEQAADRILPLLKELTANTTAAINHLNQNKPRPVAGPYPQYLRENAETAHQLSDTVWSLFQYEKTMTEVSALKSKLKLTGQ